MTAIIPENFHFIRPDWLFALVPAVLFFVLFLIRNGHSSQWSRAVNRDLLPHLLDGGKSGGRSTLISLLFVAWIIATIAMAGPAWTKLPKPVKQKKDALVIIQDLSLSFFAQDLSPDRITRARRKLLDILKSRKEGTTALIAYSADAHTIVPLTDDIRTIENMVPALSPEIMPGYGSNVTAAIRKGLELLKNGAAGRGRMLLITDEVTANDVDDVSALLSGWPVSLSVIGVGTENGGPVPQKDGGFWKDRNGKIIVPKMDRGLLKELAEKNGGRYSDIRLTDSDFEYVLAGTIRGVSQNEYQKVQREFDTWQDMGSRLVILLIPLALIAFRRGLIVALLLCIVFGGSNTGYAMSWQDLWLTRDQQAARSMKSGDFKGAAGTFKTPQWKGAAEFKAGNYEKAAKTFGTMENGDSYYNLGNSLAKGGKLSEAIQAYDKALQYEPDMKDAVYNRDLVKKLLQQQKQEQQDQQKNDQKKDGKDKKNGQGKNGKDKQNQNQQGSDSKDKKGDKGQQQKKQGDQSQDKKENSGSSSSDKKKAGQKQRRKQNQGQDQKQGQKQDQSQGQKQEQEKKQGHSQDQSQAQQKKQARKEDKDSGKDKSGAEAIPKTGDKKQDKGEKNAQSIVEGKQLSAEEQQEMEQLLRKIPDDPGGLLRRKFEYEYQLNHGRTNSNNNNKIW